MNLQNPTLICALCLTLTACGGSGEDTMVEPEDEYTPPVSPEDAAWDKLSNEEKWASVGKGGDNYFVRLNTTARDESHSLSFPDKNNRYKVEIEGNIIDIKNNNGISIVNPDNGDTEPSWKMFAGSAFSNNGVSDEKVSHILSYIGSKYFTTAVLRLSGDNSHEYAFIEGNYTPIPDIPTQGQVNYDVNVGYQMHTEESFIQSNSRRQTVKVDFATHKVKATFPFETDKDKEKIEIKINADIKGNKFSSPDDAQTRVKGGFFGDNGREIGGIFHNTEVLGVFAGKKQKPH